uniref:Uncharacterized protein n=1 Tax=Ditylenchus dipsaci TaxID=166011 RepID=A0A915DAD5_9BILA
MNSKLVFLVALLGISLILAQPSSEFGGDELLQSPPRNRERPGRGGLESRGGGRAGNTGTRRQGGGQRREGGNRGGMGNGGPQRDGQREGRRGMEN